MRCLAPAQLLGGKSKAKPPASGDVKILESGVSVTFEDFEAGLGAIKKSLVRHACPLGLVSRRRHELIGDACDV